MTKPSPIVVIGSDFQCGTYLLRIRNEKEVNLPFGRFKDGKRISVPAGEYTYVGSALSVKGATSLAYRLVRHATLSGEKPSHHIRSQMIRRFQEVGFVIAPLQVRPILEWISIKPS